MYLVEKEPLIKLLKTLWIKKGKMVWSVEKFGLFFSGKSKFSVSSTPIEIFFQVSKFQPKPWGNSQSSSHESLIQLLVQRMKELQRLWNLCLPYSHKLWTRTSCKMYMDYNPVPTLLWTNPFEHNRTFIYVDMHRIALFTYFYKLRILVGWLSSNCTCPKSQKSARWTCTKITSKCLR